jgi:hypothetical protein
MGNFKITKKRKSFYFKEATPLPFIVESECPDCQSLVKTDLENDEGFATFRLMINKKHHLWQECLECGTEYSVNVLLNVDLEAL